MHLPLWSFALVLAALAPYAVRVIERTSLERVRRRTLALLEAAGVPGAPPTREGERQERQREDERARAREAGGGP